jgi:hypothetical protein
MDNRTWTTADKSTWGPGPWQDEPDKIQFTDERTGLPCLIRRSRHGSLCGYVGVSEGHPWFERGDMEVVVHDEISYAAFCQEGDEAETICHVPGPGEPDRVWCLGFSCGGSWDVRPAMDARDRIKYGWEPIRSEGDSYKDIAYVKDQCALLSVQARAAQSKSAAR